MFSPSVPGAPMLTFPAAFHAGPDFYFSLLVFVIGIAACIYFLFEWMFHRGHRFLLFWAFSFLALYWFQVPTILANAGVGFTLTDFNLFYATSFPLGFIGLLFLYFGIRSAWPEGVSDRIGFRAIIWWAAAAFIFLTWYVASGSPAATHLLPSIAVLFFFVPAQLLVFAALWRWYRVLPEGTGSAARLGIITMAAATGFILVQGLISFRQILSYPPEFWFVAISGNEFVFILQGAGLLLLLLGFFLVHADYRRRRLAGIVRPLAQNAGAPATSVARSFPKLVISIVVPEVAGIVGAFATLPSIPNWYANLNLPSFTPPGWIFSFVWTALFFLMGVAAYLVWRRGLAERKVRAALAAFLIQLALNVGWSIIFFGAHFIFYAFLEIIILWLAILWTIILFARLSRAAAWLLAPYLAWVSFAAYLTYTIWRMN